MRLIKILILTSLSACLAFGVCSAEAQCALPYQLANGQTADASQVMANFNALISCFGNGSPAGSTNSVQYNAGSGAFGGVGPLANGQLVIGSTGNQPQAATLVAGANVTITNGPGNITIASTAGGGPSTPVTWIRLVLMHNNGGNAYAWAETVVTDTNGNPQMFVSGRSSQVYDSATPSLAFDGNLQTSWSSVDTSPNFFDVQFATPFIPGSLTITAAYNASYYNDCPIDVLVYGSNDGITFRSLGSVHFSTWTTPSQVQTVALPAN